MSKRNSLTPLAAAIAVASATTGFALSSTPAFAQEAEDSAALEEVIVTASRREEQLQDVAMAVTVVDVGQYIDAGLSSLTDILPFVPGVSVVNNGATYGNNVYVRGINAVLSAGVVSYVDDIPFGSSTVYTNPTPLDGTLLDIGSMDVLKGPQGTLYGASAIGGVLKYNTRKPSLDQWTGSLTADLSTTDSGGLNQLYRVNANGPVVSDTLGVSFTGFWKDKSGYIDNVSIPRDGWDDYEYYGGSGSIRWAATEKLEFNLQGLYQKSTQDGLATIQANYGQDQLLPGKGPAEPWYGEYQTGEGDINPSEFEAKLVGLTIKYDLDFATLTSVTSYQKSNLLNSADVTLIYGPLYPIFYPDDPPPQSVYFVGDLGFEKKTQELRLTSKSNEQFEWIVGGFYSSEDGHNIQRLDSVPARPGFYSANFPSGFDQWALFANGTYYFRPDLDATVGLRYSDYSNDVVLETEGPLIAPIPKSTIDDSVTTYMFNLRYRPTDTMSVYGRIASGYRPGGANFLLLDPNGQPLTDPFFKPDELWSYEVGLKGTSADGRLGYDVAAYYIDWTDYIINVVRGGATVAGNADKATSQGIEAALSYAVTEAFTLTGSVSYTDAQIGSNDKDLGAPDGTQLPATPKWQFALNANYDFTLAARDAYVGAAWRYKDSMPVGFPGYTDSSGMYYQPSSPRVDIGSFNIVDLRAGIALGPLDLSLYVTNVFNEWAYTYFAPTYSGPSLGTPTRPRTFGAVARWNFR
ncbi:MAG: TonB-dependent receptor [Lysobacterales bacterium]|jgi:outer membrane receptor protein involved in Fe transport